MKDKIKDWVINNNKGVPLDILDFLVSEWQSNVSQDLGGLIKKLESANYLDDDKKEKTRQARRQYVLDCISAKKLLPLF